MWSRRHASVRGAAVGSLFWRISLSGRYHHFFPRAYLKKHGEDPWYVNHVANITIVDDYLNKRQIRAKAPSVHVRTFARENPRLGDTMKTHLIDLDRFGVWEDDYEVFFRGIRLAGSRC